MESRLPESQKILFLSDVHLGAFSDEENNKLENELIGLLDFAEERQFKVAVLGDLFDYWIEYPDFVPSLGKKLLQRFRTFNTNGNKSLYITGNHDNWTLGHFRNCGFDVEPDHRILHINNSKLVVMHGDAIGDDLNNLKRPPFHRLLRNSFFLKIYRTLLPPQSGLQLMRLVSKMSRTTGKNTDEIEILNRWSKQMLKQSDIDYIICGHDHVPRRLKYSFGTYLNLGTFYKHKTLAMYNNGELSLVNWNSGKQRLTPLEPQKTENEQLG